MWRIEEEKIKEEKTLCMTSYEETQRKDVLYLKERKIASIVENLVTWRKIVGLKNTNKEMKMMMTIRNLMLRVMIYTML